jgi:hypothetical protein
VVGPDDPPATLPVAHRLRAMADWVCADRSPDMQATVEALLALEGRVDLTAPDPADPIGWIDARLG